MTEPDVASSDATNLQTSIVRDGDDQVINGRKGWSSGVGDPRCKLAIVMGKIHPDAPGHAQQSQILVPLDVQAFGAAGVSTDAGLAKRYASMRILRLADGPDEVHHRTIARIEYGKYRRPNRHDFETHPWPI